jgi:hypothetical protein
VTVRPVSDLEETGGVDATDVVLLANVVLVNFLRAGGTPPL